MATKTPPGSPQGQPDPQPSTPATPTPQPSPSATPAPQPARPTPPITPRRGPIRDRWSLLTGLLIGAVVVIVVWILVANHVFTGTLVSDSALPRPDGVQTTAPATPSATATSGSPTSTPTGSASSPSATASAGAGVPTGGSSTPTSTAACNTVPTVPQQSLAVTLPQPAGSTEARSELQQIAGAGYKTVFYTGEPKSATVVNQWMSDVQCTGMASALQVDNVFNQSSDADGKTFVAAVQGHTDLTAFVVSMNGVPDGTSEAGNASAVNSRVAAIKSQTGKPVWCELDFMTSSQASAYSSCDRHIIGYFPWKNSAKYGPVSALKDVGSLTKQLDGAGATVGVQAFDWWTSEPAAAKALGFTQNTAGLPAPTDVRDMAKLAKDHGSVNVLVVSEEPAADNVAYLVAIGNACRPTCTCPPQGS